MKTLICASGGSACVYCPKCLVWENVNVSYTCKPERAVTRCPHCHVNHVLCLTRGELGLLLNDPHYTPDTPSCASQITQEQVAQYSESLANPLGSGCWYSVGVTEMSKSEMSCTECGRIFHPEESN